MIRARKTTRERSTVCRRNCASICFIAAFLCLICALILSLTVFRRGRNVRASADTQLSTVVFQTTGYLPYTPDNDAVTSAVCTSVKTGYANLRAKYGLGTVTASEILDRAALYAAANALAALDPSSPDLSAVSTSAGATLKNISGISGYSVLVLEQFDACNPASASTCLLNSLKNTYQGAAALLRSGAATFGTSLCLLSDGRSTFACFVFCCSDTAAADPNGVLADISGLFPGKLYEIDPATALAGMGTGEISGNTAGETSGNTSGETAGNNTVYVKKGGTLAAETVSGVLALRDRRGDSANVSWGAEALSTETAGNTELSVTVTFLGTTFLRYVNVSVLDGVTAPRIDPEITGNTLPEGELLDVSEYVNVVGAGNISRISCSPLFIRSDPAGNTSGNTGESAEGNTGESASGNTDETAAGNTIRVIAENFAGDTAVQQVTCSLTETERQPVQPAFTDNSGLNVFVTSGQQLCAGGHTLINWNCAAAQNQTGECVYTFTLVYPDGHSETFTHLNPYLVWDPAAEGVVELQAALTVDGTEAANGLIRVIVAQAGEIVYNTATLRFSAESGIVTETYGEFNALLGLNPGTTAADLKSYAVIEGGLSPYVTLTDAGGTEAADEGKVATAWTLSLYDGGELLESYTVVILGDLNGDGAVGIADFAKLRQELLRGSIVTGIYLRAADLNHDGSVGIADFAKLRQFLLGKVELTI